MTGTVKDRNVLKNILEDKCRMVDVAGYMEKRDSVKLDNYEGIDGEGQFDATLNLQFN